ncbi:uncharacterized protein LOC135340880 [Halichondria panicea]|uniref:uncharacterized protein LOC135340880 n=1 Tax=Halichondria panicea TaxID=6063 RepID=UPI00312B6077
MLQYEHSIMETVIESDRESNKSEDGSDSVQKEQAMFVWSPKYEKWHESLVSFNAPCLNITEYEDLKLEVNPKQLEHLTQRWYHGSLTRREARVILQDFKGGQGSFIVRTSESYSGKFAISFMHECRVKHVVIESKRDPVTGVIYNITPNGPFFSSLSELIDEAQKKALIQNHTFDIKLGQYPPQPNMSWLHRGVKSLSQAEQILRKEHRDGAFFVYRTQSEHAPYIVAYRSEGSIHHNLIVATQRPNPGFTLNNITSQVLYKVIHYFMENPINGNTVLKHPVPDRDPVYTSYGIALKDSHGDRGQSELEFARGSFITNIQQKTADWCIGDHRGDKQKFFKRECVQLLRKEELMYLNEVRLMSADHTHPELNRPVQLNLQTDYEVNFTQEDNLSTTIHVHPVNPILKNFRSYKLSCCTTEDLEAWYQLFQSHKCLPKSQMDSSKQCKQSKFRGCVIS